MLIDSVRGVRKPKKNYKIANAQIANNSQHVFQISCKREGKKKTMNKLPPLNFDQLCVTCRGDNSDGGSLQRFEETKNVANASDATPLDKPPTVVLPPVSPRSPRLMVSVDSPRPSEASVQRRLSQSAPKNRQSPLRFSLSETSFEHFLPLPTPLQGSSNELDRAPHRRHANARKIATTSGVLSSSGPAAAQLNIVVPRGVSGSTAADKDSPPFGRLESHPAPLHMLEQVFHAPGGGIELRQVLGIYTSKRAAEHAARCYFDENRESHEHFENMRLVTKEVPVDKAATETHPEQTVNLEKK